jgi:hypothetical protein
MQVMYRIRCNIMNVAPQIIKTRMDALMDIVRKIA